MVPALEYLNERTEQADKEKATVDAAVDNARGESALLFTLAEDLCHAVRRAFFLRCECAAAVCTPCGCGRHGALRGRQHLAATLAT